MKIESFDSHLFRLVHDEITADKLLSVLKVRFYDNVQSNHRNMLSILNKGTKAVAKYIFLVEHYGYYIRNIFDSDLGPEEDIFHVLDQHDEAKLELINSILLARAGMIYQAINTLRRAFESALYGSFFSTNSFHVGKKTENPFVQLIEKGLWSTRAGNRAIRYSQIKPIIKDICSRDNVPRGKAELRVLIGFAEYYLEYLCDPVCSDHYNKRKDAVSSLPKGLRKKCNKCDREDANKVLVQNPVTMGLMIAVTDAKLRRRADRHIDLNAIYSGLSSFLHPNPESHQHEPAHQFDPLREWLDYITETVNTLTWFYVRCTQRIGYEEKATNKLLDSKKHNMNKVTLYQLSSVLCKVVADHENRVL